jgi:hypothetical protein
MKTKSYCKRCKRFLSTNNFYEREDRPGYYAFCKGCMKKTPLFSRVWVNDDWVTVMEKPSREFDYPELEMRGYGKL